MYQASGLKELRWRRGLNQRELAAELGIGQSVLAKWETGAEPSAKYMRVLIEYAERFKLSPSFLSSSPSQPARKEPPKIQQEVLPEVLSPRPAERVERKTPAKKHKKKRPAPILSKRPASSLPVETRRDSSQNYQPTPLVSPLPNALPVVLVPTVQNHQDSPPITSRPTMKGTIETVYTDKLTLRVDELPRLYINPSNGKSSLVYLTQGGEVWKSEWSCQRGAEPPVSEVVADWTGNRLGGWLRLSKTDQKVYSGIYSGIYTGVVINQAMYMQQFDGGAPSVQMILAEYMKGGFMQVKELFHFGYWRPGDGHALWGSARW